MTFEREKLPDPVSYYEAQGLTLQGPRNAAWKTTECRFHRGSDSMRIKVGSGAFVCMACGARGGDVLAYQMAAYGQSFIEAAKQLGAWSGGKPSKEHIRPNPFSARDALNVLVFEGTLVAIADCRSAKGIKPNPEDLERIMVAVGRLNHVAGKYV
jgi:hypothetical protein